MFGLSQIQLIIIGGLLAVVITAGGITYIYSKGEKAGAGDVRAKVATETTRATNEARTDKEKANEKARNTPLDALIDALK